MDTQLDRTIDTSAGKHQLTFPNNQMQTVKLSNDELSAMFKSFQSSAWRLELLPVYLIPTSTAFKDFLAGEPFPASQDGSWWLHNQEWRALIASHVKEGRSFGRVHVMPNKMTEYLRYEVEWGYCYNYLAGDNIRLLEFSRVPSELKVSEEQDFWIFDDSTVVLCDYHTDGAWIGARKVIDDSYLSHFLNVKALSIQNSIDLKTFLKNYRTGKYS